VPAGDAICDAASTDSDFSNRFYKGQVSYVETRVPQVSLDAFIESNLITGVNLIKIDVENHEKEVFLGAEKLLSKFAPIIFSEIYFEEEKAIFLKQFLCSKGYHFYGLLSEGILKMEGIVKGIDNYLLTKIETQKQFVKYQDSNVLLRQLSVHCRQPT